MLWGEPSGTGARQTILATRSGITIMRQSARPSSIPGLARRLCQFPRADGYLSRGSILSDRKSCQPCVGFVEAVPLEGLDLYLGMGDERVRRIEAAPATVHCQTQPPGTSADRGNIGAKS